MAGWWRRIKIPAVFHVSSRRDSRSHAASHVIRRNTNRRHMNGDYPGRAADTATVLLTAADEIRGTHGGRACRQGTFGPGRLPRECPSVEAEMIKMPVLVVYASKHGATRGIAGRIAAGLRTAGCQADVRSVKDAGNLAAYDAFVIGSAAYELHWRKEATEFVRRNREVLAARPVGLFSSGPLGTEPADAKGRDLRTVTVPKEIPEFTQALHPRGHHVFFGALDPAKLTFAERSLRKLRPPARLFPAATSATGRRSMTGQLASPANWQPHPERSTPKHRVGGLSGRADRTGADGRRAAVRGPFASGVRHAPAGR
jgi:menaquinone-dependent protoporphyrinogen oxidase